MAAGWSAPPKCGTLLVSKSLQGENQFGPLTVGYGRHGEFSFHGGRSGGGSYRITDSGETCYQFDDGRSSCQVLIQTSDGHNFYDETSAWRSTIKPE